MDLKNIAKIVINGENIAIFGHVSTDMDCLGSVFSLKKTLNLIGKKVDVFVDSTVSEKNKPLFFGESVSSNEFDYRKYDLIIITDTPNKMRLGKYGEEVVKHKNIVKLDHHREVPSFFSEQEYVDINASSASEICYLLIKELNVSITPEIATLIYAGISSDTSSFVNDNVTALTFQISSELIKLGADISLVNEVMYKSDSMEDWELDKLAYEKAEFYNNFAIIPLKYKDLTGISNKDGLSRYAKKLAQIDKVKIGCSMSEKNLRTYDISFRSKKSVAVNEIASALGGGGHKNAAACIVSGNYNDVKKKVIETIKDSLKKQGFLDD